MSNSILAKMAVLISANTAAFDKNLHHSETQFQKFTSTITKGASAIGLAFGSVAIFNGLKYGVGIIQDFEHRMSEVNAITQASASEFSQLRNSALELGKATKFSAEEVAGLQVEFGKLGFSTQEILNSTKATLELATATGEDLAGSAEIAGSTLRAFGLEATEMQRVVDVMAASFNKSALGLSNFGEAIKYVAPVAAAANISLEETTAMLGVLADAGIRGSMAGTSLRKIISDVKDETGTLSERLQKMADKGLTGADAMDEVGRTAYASLLVLTKNVDKVNEATIAYQNSSGEAEKMARLMGDDLTGDVKKLNSAFEAAILSGSGVSGTLRGIVQAVTDLINLMNSSGFFQGVIGGLEAIVKQGMLIPTVVKAIRDYNKANKEVAITAEENQAIIDKVWGKPEDVNKIAAAIVSATEAQIVTIDSLKDKEKALQDQFSQTDINDKQKLKNIGDQILAIEKQIQALENLKKIQEGGPTSSQLATAGTTTGVGLSDKASGDFLNDLGMDNAATQVEEATNRISAAMINNEQSIESWGEQMRLSADLVAQKMIDVGPIISGAITGIAESIGNAAAGNGDFGKDLIKGVADFAKQLGALFIATGVAEAAFQSGNPYAMIAAGVALVALGAATSAMMQKQSEGSKAMSMGGSGSGPGRLPSEMDVEINGRVSGYSLEIVGSKEGYRRSRVG